MIHTSVPIYLASGSPRRKKLLKQINLKFKVITVDIDEKILKNELPAASVTRLAEEKLAKAREKIKKGIIITADTIVVLDNYTIGKPKSKKDAAQILRMLSGRTHYVFTGFSVFSSENDKTITKYVKTAVTFRKLTEEEIQDYIASGSPMDKAGAYGIQDDFGAVFVEKINGSYYNVVGLPLSKLYETLLRITRVAGKN